MLDPHEILGVTPGASPELLQRAFKKAVRRHHPDLNPNDAGAPERLRKVVAAYQSLTRKRPQPAAPGTMTVVCRLRGADLLGTLHVDMSRLAPDRWLAVELTALDACPVCGGAGWEEVAGSWGRTERWECESCRGAGILRVERRVRMRVPAKAVDGTQVRLRGIGLGRASSMRGDAVIVIRQPSA
jgi:molecular chaperone DnaJ